MNPYLNRVMIRNPHQFYGRRSEVRRILARIGAERPQSISIVGDRRIGKSSLLYYLSRPEILEEHFANTASPEIVFLDFQQMGHLTLEQFFRLLLDQIKQADDEIPENSQADYAAFQNLLQYFHKQKKKLVLLLDEFQAVTSNNAFKNEFYSFLRSMANNYEVAYVTTSSIELQRLCFSSDISDSPFFNIFSNLYLKPFQREEACELISGPSEEEGVPLRQYTDEILQIAGMFPFYLQIACSVFFDCLKGNPDKKPDTAEVNDIFLEEAGPHFEYFWEHLTAEHQEVLLKLIRGEDPKVEELHLCEALQRKGYLIREQDRFRIFSPAFSKHIRELTNYSSGSTRSTVDIPVDRNFSPETGSSINQYRILRKAGEGGMGIVYEAEDISLQRKVALKFIKSKLLQDDTSQKRFLKEARSAASLNHSAIASVFELFEHNGHQGLAMEWIDGTTLKQRITAQGRIEPSQAIVWMVEALDGLENAHQKGIIHRDINSNNLMITAKGHVKITDFGLAKSYAGEQEETTEAITVMGALVGTIDYMSPEQAQGAPLSTQSDLYSLGVAFFEAITGKLPFKGKTVWETLHAILYKPVPALNNYGIVNPDLDSFLNTALAKTPNERYSDITAMKEGFARLLQP